MKITKLESSNINIFYFGYITIDIDLFHFEYIDRVHYMDSIDMDR